MTSSALSLLDPTLVILEESTCHVWIVLKGLSLSYRIFIKHPSYLCPVPFLANISNPLHQTEGSRLIKLHAFGHLYASIQVLSQSLQCRGHGDLSCSSVYLGIWPQICHLALVVCILLSLKSFLPVSKPLVPLIFRNNFPWHGWKHLSQINVLPYIGEKMSMPRLSYPCEECVYPLWVAFNWWFYNNYYCCCFPNEILHSVL